MDELDDARAVFAEQCPNAQAFTHLNDMLAAYGFPIRESESVGTHGSSELVTEPMVSSARLVAAALGRGLMRVVRHIITPVLAALLLVAVGAPHAPRGVPATYWNLPDPTLAAFMGTLGSLHVLLAVLIIGWAPMMACVYGVAGFLIGLIRTRDRLTDPFHTDNVALLNYVPTRATLSEACHALTPAVAGGVAAALKMTTFLFAYALLAPLPMTAELIATVTVTLAIHVLVTTGPALWKAIAAGRNGATT
ncbi:hypothetical protein NLB33_24835 [Mycolicibacterium smegmatis]|uniref:hypothetical protein n=1 Tax=Mycolicibacterium smegmatis TaxID=1772 RepID=UPI0020A5FB2E|nr:hypothetical protein [Mycolicibacterium smegmatis]MCP2626071.1 hypothetical protein [Mycolicibacterium smegmatis]